MTPSLDQRHREHEWMDAADASEGELRRSLVFIERVNRWLRYTRATVSHLQRFSQSWPKGQTIRVLDLATGSGDVPAAIGRWGARRGLDVRVVGVELHRITARIAAERGDSRFAVVRADARALPFGDGSFDYAICSMFLHHLDDGDIVRVLREMDRVARRGVIAADLLRHRRAYAWISLFTLLAGPMVRHDARSSVRQALTEREMLHLRDRAGLSYARFHRHFGHRFVLAGEKDDAF